MKHHLYFIINIYKKYRLEFIQSIKKRLIFEDYEKVINIIDESIVSIKEKDHQFNVACRNKNTSASKEEIKRLKIEKLEIVTKIRKLQEKIGKNILSLPNLIHEDIVEEDKIIFEEKQHEYMFKEEDCFDLYVNENFIRTKYRTLIFNEEISKLYKDLENLFYQHNIENGFKYIQTNLFATEEDLYNSGHLPKYKNDLFLTEKNIYLIPTSETLLLKYVLLIKEIKEDIIKIFTNTMCFRKENSVTSKINKPLIRQGAFCKTETFILSKKELSKQTMDILINNVKNLLLKLKLNYRIVQVGSKEMSHSAYIQYDFEIYFPSKKQYIEIASCSNCFDYQLWRSQSVLNNEYNTFNCTSLAVDRIIAVLIEQQRYKL